MDPRRNVNIVIAIDAEALLAAYPDGGGDLASPIELPDDTTSRYLAMLASGSSAHDGATSAGRGEAGVQIAADAGAAIRLFARSLQPIEYAVALRCCELAAAAPAAAAPACHTSTVEVIGMAPGQQPTEDHLEVHREVLHWWELAATGAGDRYDCRFVVQLWSTAAADDGPLVDCGCFSWHVVIRAMQRQVPSPRGRQ
jgi:hypothetical protein